MAGVMAAAGVVVPIRSQRNRLQSHACSPKARMGDAHPHRHLAHYGFCPRCGRRARTPSVGFALIHTRYPYEGSM